MTGIRTSPEQRNPLSSVRGTSLLQEFLVELAFTLLPRGMTPKRFGELARYAFVRAAADLSRPRNGKVNYSRVSAQTGLSRGDVRRLLEHDALPRLGPDRAPVERAINGWRTDPQFTDRSGHPKRLKKHGLGASFVALARKFGGDVPHKALLDELRRMGAVSCDEKSVRLRKSQNLRRRNDFAFLSPVLPALVDSLRIASRRVGSKASSSIHRLSIPAETELDLAIMRERCVSSAKSMLDGLGDSLKTRVSVPQRRRNSPHSFIVTVLLVENKALGREFLAGRRQ
ncbi:MAG: DUF6502 family protein [Steroidobacteraceae bacterium]